MTTKEKILQAALELFNSSGVETITTRHIAASLNMSQGNLHYHYPNKNEIILVLLGQFLEKIRSASRNTPGTIFMEREVLQSMRDHFQIMYTYRFLFQDNKVVWRRLPHVREQINQAFSEKHAEIRKLILFYRDQGAFRLDISVEQIDFLAEQFIFSISTWLTAAEYMGISEEAPEYFSRFIFRHWLPYLNEAEMNKWEAVL